MIEHAQRWNDQRNTLDFQTDGLVVKVDDLNQRERLGARSKSPRWTIAFKYEAEQAITELVGHQRSGRKDGQADAGGRSRARATGRHDRQARHLAQRRRARAQGHQDRRRRRHPEGRRDHSSGRAGRDRRAQGHRDSVSVSRSSARVAAPRSNGRATRSTYYCTQSAVAAARTSSRNGSAGTLTATPWISTAWARS